MGCASPLGLRRPSNPTSRLALACLALSLLCPFVAHAFTIGLGRCPVSQALRSSQPQPAVAGPSPPRLVSLAAAAASRTKGGQGGGGLTFRRGTADDAPLIRRCMQESRMNPLFLTPENFVVAEGGPGSGVQGFGQIRPVPGSDAVFELASVYVLPEARDRGVGSQIVAELVRQFQQQQQQQQQQEGGGRRLVLLTLADTGPFYERHGFEVLDDPTQAGLPPLLVGEFLAGSVVARISRGAGTRLVCMEWTRTGAGAGGRQRQRR